MIKWYRYLPHAMGAFLVLSLIAFSEPKAGARIPFELRSQEVTSEAPFECVGVSLLIGQWFAELEIRLTNGCERAVALADKTMSCFSAESSDFDDCYIIEPGAYAREIVMIPDTLGLQPEEERKYLVNFAEAAGDAGPPPDTADGDGGVLKTETGTIILTYQIQNNGTSSGEEPDYVDGDAPDESPDSADGCSVSAIAAEDSRTQSSLIHTLLYLLNP
jgi:hypothetical protein